MLFDSAADITNKKPTQALDASGSTVKTKESIVPESGSLKTTFKNQSFTQSGVTFTLEKSFDSLSEKEQFMWRGLYTWWAKGALDLVEKSYGFSFTDSDSQFKKIRILFVNDSSSSNYTAKAFDKIYDDPDGKYVYVGINMHYFNDIDKNSLEGKYPAWDDYYLNRLIAHELTHVVMNAKIDSFSTMPALILEGTAELTGGMDDSQDTNIKKAVAGYIFLRYLAKQASTRGEDLYVSAEKKSLAGGQYEDTLAASADKVTIRGNASNDSLSNNGASSVKILGGDGADQIFSYGNKITLDGGKDDDYFYLYSDASNALVKGGSGNDEIHSAAKKATIDAGTGNDYVQLFNNATKTTLDAGAGNDSIENTADNVSIFGGAGNDSIHGGNGKDTLWGDSGNDKLWGGDGLDTFIFTAGEGTDRIFDYETGDMLKILNADGSDGSFKSSKYSGGDLTLTINSGGKIVFKDVSASTNFNINSTSYKISGSKLK